jgi:Htaa
VRAGDSTRTAAGGGIWALGAALAAAVILALAPGASAKVVPVSGGTTTLKISRNVGEFLADTGTKVKAVDPAKEKKKGFALPIATGELDDKKVRGSLKHDGGLDLKGDGGKFELTRFQAKFGKSSKLKAKLDGKSSALFDLDTDNAKAKETDGTIKVNRVKVLLSAKGVKLIEDVTDMHLDDEDVVFGKLKVAAETGGGELPLTGGDATLGLDSSLKSALSGQGITASAVDPATKTGDEFSFPVIGGKVADDGGSGQVRLDGALRLTKGATTLELSKLRIHVEDGKITAVVDGTRKTLISFDANKVEPTIKGDKVTLSGIEAKLTQDGAAAINDAFGGTAFSDGDAVGTFEVEATSG